MNISMWLLTTTCLACGAADSGTPVAPAPSGPAPVVIQNPSPGSQNQTRAMGAYGYGAAYHANYVENCTSCDEHPGLLARLFSRLRALFSRCHSDSCCEGVAKCETTHSSLCENSCDCEQHGLGLRERLARLFHRPGSEVPCCAPAQTMVVQVLPPTQVQPAVQLATPIRTSPVIQPVSTAPAPSTQIAKEYLNKVANAEDYSWVTGQLFYIHIHADQGLWFVRYAPVDKEDRYGGSVVLAPATSMTNFREGDLVTVHGEILNQGRASRYLGGPHYRALAVELKERARFQE